MQNKVKKQSIYLFLVLLIILLSGSIFFFYNGTKQEDTLQNESVATKTINFSQLDGYYLGFTKVASSVSEKQLVFFRIQKFYPKASETPQANMTYLTLDSSTLAGDSYDALTNELSNKAPDKLLDHLSVFGQGPIYWSSIAELSGENKAAAPLLYASKENDKLRVIIDYNGSEEPGLNSFSLVKLDKNKMNDKGISLIKEYLVDPGKNETAFLNYYGMIDFDEAIAMVDEESARYIGTTASQILN